MLQNAMLIFAYSSFKHNSFLIVHWKSKNDSFLNLNWTRYYKGLALNFDTSLFPQHIRTSIWNKSISECTQLNGNCLYRNIFHLHSENPIVDSFQTKLNIKQNANEYKLYLKQVTFWLFTNTIKIINNHRRFQWCNELRTREKAMSEWNSSSFTPSFQVISNKKTVLPK